MNICEENLKFMGIFRSGKRSFQIERRSRSRSMLNIGVALSLHIFKWSGAAVPAPGDWSAAPRSAGPFEQIPLYML